MKPFIYLHGNNHNQMSTQIQPELLLKDTTTSTFISESEKLKELFNDPTIDVERYIELQEIKQQRKLNL
jgi:hypothetical protein